jgi:hypothetical protein
MKKASPPPEGVEPSPSRPLSKHAREVRAGILDALERLLLRSDLAEFFAWWKQLGQSASSRATWQEYRAHLEGRGLAPASIDQEITVLRWYAHLLKSAPPVVQAVFLVPLFQFQAANPDIFAESFEEWKARVSTDHQRDWQQFLDKQEVAWRAVLSSKKGSPLLNEIIIGGPIAEPKLRRGPGKTGRNARIEDRYTWAAEWLRGRDWKDIAAEVQKTTDTVRRGATDILHTAGFGKSDRLPGNRK